MKLYNTTTKEEIFLEINDPETNTNMAGDIIGNSFSDLVWTIINDEEILSGDNNKCEWWVNYCATYNNNYTDVCDLLEEKEELKEEYHNFINGVEFNDIPLMMLKFFEENK